MPISVKAYKKDVYMDKHMLATIFPKIWCRETSSFPETWTLENPAHGQCLSTARIVQTYLGGNVVLAYVGPERFIHFYNLLVYGVSADFTDSQFLEPVALYPVKVMDCEDLDDFGLIFPEVARRYELLSSRLQIEVNKLVV